MRVVRGRERLVASASGTTAPAAGLGGIGGGVRLHGNGHPTEPERPLLPLFRQAARGRCHEVSQLFERSAAALAVGRSPETVWCQAVSCLPVSETDKRALSELVNALQGDEASTCKGILLARKDAAKQPVTTGKAAPAMRKSARRPFVFPPRRCW